MGLLDTIYAATSAGVGDVKRNLLGLWDDPKGEILRRAQARQIMSYSLAMKVYSRYWSVMEYLLTARHLANRVR